jgi:hypothetical protein
MSNDNAWTGFLWRAANGDLEGELIDPMGFKLRIEGLRGRRCDPDGSEQAGYILTAWLVIPDALQVPWVDYDPEEEDRRHA